VIDHEVVDFGANANGRPDPGETVDLIATLRNFGSDAFAVQVELDTTDPHITIIDGVADLGDVASGAVVSTGADPFSFEVAADAPTGTVVSFSVRATFSGGETMSDLALYIGKIDYLVWDPTPDQSSGPAIAAALDHWSYVGTVAATLPIDRLDDYATLWVSVGVYPENHVVDASASEGPAIVDFLANGGCVYLEGGDVWAYDSQYGGFDFRPHFGISATQDGSADLAHVLGVVGQLSEGMDFVYTGENSFIDHLDPVALGEVLLRNSSPTYNCGIAGDAGVYRTIGTSFELGGLVDGAEPSTRTTLVRAIMEFFQVAHEAPIFADGFECGACTAWSLTQP
jgi:hypothetical protein